MTNHKDTCDDCGAEVLTIPYQEYLGSGTQYDYACVKCDAECLTPEAYLRRE